MLDPISLKGEAATLELAQDTAMVAEPGWIIRLEGHLGAGKTTFARAYIRTLAGDDGLEVPSPTYTLVQRYDEAEPTVLHADLYRLGDPSELTELGLDDETDTAIRLIEWPERAGDGYFEDAISLSFTMDGEATRILTATGPADKLQRLARTIEIRAFLEQADLAQANRQRLTGDASTRRYEQLPENGLILMDAAQQPDGPIVRDGKPYSQLVHLAESVHAFAAVGTALSENGFAAPHIHAANLDAGLLLIEDLGRDGILDKDGAPVPERSIAAAQLLADLHKVDWPYALPVPGAGQHKLHRYDTDVFLTEIDLCPSWYVAHRGVDPRQFDRNVFEQAWRAILKPLDDEPATLTLRDYHSPNIIWRDDKAGNDRLGLIDHQDAMLGPPAYDIASLVYDARVTISKPLREAMIDAYLEASDVDEEWLKARVAIMAAQRNTKILGIFARLNARDGKPGYLKHLPRVEDYMRETLQHPALASLRPYYDQLLPGAP